MRRTLVITVVLALLLLLGFVYYGLDPASSGVFPQCMFMKLTGYKCPGCGSQRAIHALLHGDVAGAFKFNAMLLISIPWITLCLFAEAQRTRRPQLYDRLNAPLITWFFMIAVLLWWLLRNIFDW